MDSTEFWLSLALVLYSLVGVVWTFAQWRRGRASGLLLTERILLLAVITWLFGQPLVESWFGWRRSRLRIILVGLPLLAAWITIGFRLRQTS